MTAVAVPPPPRQRPERAPGTVVAPRTATPQPAAAPPPAPRRGVGRPTPEQRMVGWGSWLAGLATAWLVTRQLLALDGLPWLLIWWFGLALVFLAVTTALRGRRTEVVDVVARAVVAGGAALVGLALVSTVVFTVLQGWRPLMHLNFFTSDMSGVGPRDSFDRGGALHAVVGSLVQLSIAIAVTVPLGIGTAVFMTEVGGRFARLVRTVVEAMTALPSIVAGLFIYTVLVIALGVPKSGLAAGMAIAVMMLPIIARAADVVLRVVPGGLREAAFALGASRWEVVRHVVLPTARPGLATALILGVARGVGETSPVLLTSGAAPFVVADPTDGVMTSLPLEIFYAVRSGEPELITRGFATATVLLALVLALFITARLLARPRTGRRRPLRTPRRRKTS